MRRKLIALYMFAIFLLCLTINVVPLEHASDFLTYYVKNSFAQTGGINIVTSIYLNYRVFDTLFETLLLLISIIAIIYFSRHEGDY